MKSAIRVLIATCVGALVTLPTHAALVTSPPITVSQIVGYSEYGGGDVVFFVSASTSGCGGGFWLRPADAGFKNLYSMLMMAYATKSTMTVSADDSLLFPGSGSQFCHVYDLNPM